MHSYEACKAKGTFAGLDDVGRMRKFKTYNEAYAFWQEKLTNGDVVRLG
jgi:hypothetical protein